MALQLRPRHRLLHNPSLVQFFSSSNSSDSTTPAPPPPDSLDSDLPPSRPRASSFFSDVKANLRSQEQSQRMRQQVTRHPSSPPQQQQPTKIVSLDEIRKGLSQFPARPTTGEQGHSYAPRMSPSSGPDPSSSPFKTSFTTIFKSLNSNTALRKPVGEDRLSLSRFTEDLKLKPDSATSTRGEIYSKTNLGKVKKGFGESTTISGVATNTDLFKIYSSQDLGEKLRNLRPEKKGNDYSGGFSFLEMNERLAKLRELEEKEDDSRVGGQYKVLTVSLKNCMKGIEKSEEEKARQKTARTIDILGQLTPGPDSMEPPQEHLVEKYFHPDNMSSAEKLKIELAKVRDEFKMSESDCGSARVQVAQLTTKIKHLSATLHKKDKHSRKGLEGMVQKRKNLLRYLRRKDWDSYCLVLSKLGLRDNPAYKL